MSAPHTEPRPLRALQASLSLRYAHIVRERNGQMPFPPEYKETLRSKDKNSTLRVDEEMGIYQEGDTYEATSYDDDLWGIKIKVLEVHSLKVGDLSDWGIPKEDIERASTEGAGSGQVELIKFEVLPK